MKLYFAPFACSLAARIALYEANLDSEFERVDLRNKVTDSGMDFWSVTAKGKVSALRLDNDEVITENPVVLQYIADQDESGALMPAFGSVERYEVVSWLSFISSEIHKMGVYPMAAPHVPAEMKAVTSELLMTQLKLVNDRLSENDYIAGQFSVADTYLFWALTLLPKLGFEMPEELTALNAYHGRLMQRPAFQKALQEEAVLVSSN
ncbi:glutathione transferase GstA [Alteromonadaceae bacterium M269]|nr:glutathione transferase GstA [Alteromonadaceae bacterium M269]